MSERTLIGARVVWAPLPNPLPGVPGRGNKSGGRRRRRPYGKGGVV